MASALTDSLILETLHNASDLSEENRAQHAEYLLKLQKLCPDKDLDWILQHPAEVFPVIPQYHTDTVSAILDTVMRIPDLSKLGTNIQAWKMQIADYVLSVTIPAGWEDETCMSEIKECTDGEIIKLIDDSADLAAKSKSGYKYRISKLQSFFPNKSLQWMCMNPDLVAARVKEAYAAGASQKAYLVPMIAIIKLNPVHQSVAQKWKQIMSDVNKVIHSKQNHASAKQQAGYVQWEDIIAARESLSKTSVEYLLLCCYTMIPPVRADFANIRIFRKEPEQHEARESPNYLQVTDSSITLVLKEYKTAKSMGDYVNELPEELCVVLRNHIEDGQKYLFTGRGGEQYHLVGTYTNWCNRLLNRVFKKPLTLTLLRHSYITYLDSNGISSVDRRAQAKLLMHNPAQFLNYVFDNV